MLTITQSLIKQVNKENYCPKFLESLLSGEKTMKQTESMLKGQYFEYKCLGNLNKEGEKIEELPLLKSGKKSADHERIDMQVNKFKELIDYYKIEIIHKGNTIQTSLEEDTMLQGTIDFEGNMKINDEEFRVIFDLKLTKSIYTQWGDFCWAFPVNMDHTQSAMYYYIYASLYPNIVNIPGLKFMYMVFDYSPEPDYKLIELNIDSLRIAELMESIRKTKERILWHQKFGFQYLPTYENCKQCMLKETCPAVKKFKDIETI